MRVDRRARRIGLRVDARDGRCVLVLPDPSLRTAGLAFARSKADWIARRLGAVAPRVPFAPGVVVPFKGVDHRVVHDPAARDPVAVGDGIVRVGGAAGLIARQMARWLRAEALAEVTARAPAKAAAIGARPGRIAVRDTRSRWGSCAASGNLSFSWRLILAPEPVLDYVVAHEVAHLVEHNHGPRFWRIVDRLCPERRAHETWLRRHGAALHRYG